jgi:hypothetical protein
MDPNTKLTTALQASRSLMFYTLTTTVPIILITAILLFTRIHGTTLVILSLLGAITGVIGFGRLLYETTLDIAGYPDYKLPIWSVFYLIVYLISTFTFLIFALHVSSPGVYFAGFPTSDKAAFLDAIYLSMCAYIGQSADAAYSMKTQSARFMSVIQGMLSMFLNVVIITKFVSAF